MHATLPRFAAAALCATLPLFGCKARPRLAPSGGASGSALEPAAGPIVAKQDFPLSEGTRRYRALSGEHAGKVVVITTAPAEAPSTWTIDVRAEAAPEPVRIDTVRVEKSGAVVLLESLNPGDKVVSRYQPPMVLLPAQLAPGETADQRFEITVHPVSNPAAVSNRGKATHTLTLEGRGALPSVGAALVVRAELAIELSGANVKRITESWYARGTGLVAERFSEEIRILGLFPRTSTGHFEIEP